MEGKHFIIEVPLYGQEVQVFFECSYEYIRSKISEKSYRDVHDTMTSCEAVTISAEDEDEYIVCFHKTYPNCSHGIVAHEFFHAAANICDLVGIPITVDNQEPVAYILSHLMDAFYAVIENKLEGTDFKVQIFTDEK